jgi:hypothetical protein
VANNSCCSSATAEPDTAELVSAELDLDELDPAELDSSGAGSPEVWGLAVARDGV